MLVLVFLSYGSQGLQTTRMGSVGIVWEVLLREHSGNLDDQDVEQCTT